MIVGDTNGMQNDHETQVESGVDWAKCWKANRMHATLNESTLHYWSDRSQRFRATSHPTGYARVFLDRTPLLDGETIIDMGCGAGTLALPLAMQGHPIIACDYSQAMLDRLTQFATIAGVTSNIEPHCISWADSWDELPVADVFIASRSLCTRDLGATLVNMEAHTRRRCCMTVPTYMSPRHDTTMRHAIGRTEILPSEDVYVVNLLMQMGRLPEVSYIKRVYPPVGEDLDDVREAFEREDGPFTPEESRLLDAFIADNFKVATDSLGVSIVHRSYVREVYWAYIAWDVPPKE